MGMDYDKFLSFVKGMQEGYSPDNLPVLP